MGSEMLQAGCFAGNPDLFPGISEFGIQSHVCGEPQGSHPKRGIFLQSRRKVAGADMSERFFLPDVSYT